MDRRFLNIYCLYFHYRRSDGIIFYVGIGIEKRPKNKINRSKAWKKEYKEHGRIVKVIAINLNWFEACLMEMAYIKKYGRRNNGTGILVNKTDGGDGICGCRTLLGYKQDKQHSKQISVRQTGQGNSMSNTNLKRLAKLSGITLKEYKNNLLINRYKDVLVTDLSTGKIKIFNKISSAARFLGCVSQIVRDAIRNKDYRSGYKIQYGKFNQKRYNETIEKLRNKKCPNERPVVAKHVDTKEEIRFDSKIKAAEYFKSNHPNTIKIAIDNGFLIKNYRLRFKGGKFKPIRLRKSEPVIVINIKNNKYKRFLNTYLAAERYNLKRNSVKNWINKKKEINGLIFMYEKNYLKKFAA